MPDYNYKPRNADAVKQQAAGESSKFTAYIKPIVPIWKRTKDLHRLRIVYPTYEGEQTTFGYKVIVHKSVGPDNKVFACLRANLGQPDPVEEDLEDARRRGRDREDWAYAQRPQEAFPTYIIDRDEEHLGIQIAPFTAKQNQDLNQSCIDPATGAVINIDDPENGYDVEVEVEEQEGRKSGDKFKILKFYPMQDPSYMFEDEKMQDRWVKFINENPLDKQIVYEDYDTIKDALGNTTHGGGGPSDGQVTTRSERRGGGGSRRPSSPSRPSRRRGAQAPSSEPPEADAMPDWANTPDENAQASSSTRPSRPRRPASRPAESSPDLRDQVGSDGLSDEPAHEEASQPARTRSRRAAPAAEQSAPEPAAEREAAPRKRSRRAAAPTVEAPEADAPQADAPTRSRRRRAAPAS